ncbi:MAG: AAA family ATPase [Spirochaetes bacterium]|nr:AAA family ATPase [Spirochaetota bacterium]
MEDISQRDFAETDPKMFLNQGKKGMIIDEIQRVPFLLSYIQTIVDENNSPGMYVIACSQNLLLMEQVSRTLAGRISLLTLLPLSLAELYNDEEDITDLTEVLYTGLYPGIYGRGFDPGR